jgi:hypothetical protein
MNSHNVFIPSILIAVISVLSATFTSGPSVTVQGVGANISFVVSTSTDVEVSVLDENGNIVRHLAAGVLGGQYDPPLPLQPGLTQAVSWDGRDDSGDFLQNSNFKVDVRLGVAPVYDTTFDCHDIWPSSWQYYPGNLNPLETYRPESDGFFNLLSYTGRPLYEQEPRLEISVCEFTDNLLVDGCSSGQGLDKSSASVFRVDGRTGAVLHIINGNNLNFGANSHYPGQGKAVYSPDSKYYYYRCALHVYRFDLEGNPAPWSGTGSHIVENLPFNDIGSAGITPGPDGSVYVVHYPYVDTIHPQYVSVIKDGVVASRGIVKVQGSLAGGVRVDKDGNIYVGAGVRELNNMYPDFLETNLLTGDECSIGSQMAWAYDTYGAILKFPPTGGRIYTDQSGNLDAACGIYPTAECLPRIYDRCSAENLIWMHKGISHILTHNLWRTPNCWCAQTRFDIDKYGRIYYPNTFMAEFVGIDNNRNTLFKVKNRDVPQVAIGVGHQVEVTDNALFVADFYNTQIVRFNWQADAEWVSELTARVEESAANVSGIKLVNTPNPFTPQTKIAVSRQQQLKADSRQLKAGIIWNAANNPPGIYFCRLKYGQYVVNHKMLLVR